MNTNWQDGLNILFDGPYNESPRAALCTAVSGQLIGAYTGYDGTVWTLYTRMQTTNGALRPPYLMPAFTRNNQKDIDLTAIDGTNEMVAVWASSHNNGLYRVYARKYSVSDQGVGTPFPPYPEILASGENGNYVCPRVIYNPTSGLTFVCWASDNERELQGIWLDRSLEEQSYRFGISKDIYSTFYYSGTELGIAANENIVLMNQRDSVIVAIQETLSKINFYRVERPVFGSSRVTLITSYPQANMGKFHAVLDQSRSTIMLVYVGPQSYVYGDRLRVFGLQDDSPDGSPTPHAEDNQPRAGIRLNNATYATGMPYIAALPAQKGQEGPPGFVVAWSCANYGIYYNHFDELFNPMAAERQINPNDSANNYPKVLVSDNQVAIVMQASRFNNNSLAGYGVLTNVARY
ncbi:hypothetical protein [Dyella sp.]|uniref:hypothetical protein n=1 Tax=Dyella sp. TaxID=1869338 RepID=UPI002FD9A5C2